MTVLDNIIEGKYENRLEYAIGRTAWREEERRLKQVLRVDLAEEYNVVGHCKEQTLFDMAWENGHSGGYREVEMQYDELSTLITWNAEAG